MYRAHSSTVPFSFILLHTIFCIASSLLSFSIRFQLNFACFLSIHLVVYFLWRLCIAHTVVVVVVVAAAVSVRFQCMDSITYFILFLYHWRRHHVLRICKRLGMKWSNIDVRGVANKTIVLRPIKCYFIYIFSICHRSSYSFYG